MPEIPESHRDLLNADIAVLATLGKNGFPQATAVWFLFDEGAIRLSLNTSRQKVKNLQARPECSLLIVDPSAPDRTLEVRARAAIEPDPNYAFADRVAKKYGADLRAMDRPGQSRVAVTLQPVKFNTWGGAK